VTKKVRVEIIGDPSSLARAFGHASASAKGFGADMQAVGGRISGVGRKLTTGLTLPLAAAGVASIKLAGDFEQTMSRIVGLAGVSEKQVGEWADELLRLAPALGKAPQELAESLYFVASSGVDVSRALGVVTVSAKASAAGLGETQVVADAVTSAMNAYGQKNMTAARATDVLVAAVREGKGEASDMAPVLGNVGAIAAQLGVSFEEVGAAMAAQTRLGLDAATAATQLQATFSALLKTTPKAEKALEGVGLSSAGLRRQLKEEGLLAMLDTLKAAFKGNTAEMAKAFPNVRALRGLLALTGKNAAEVAGIFGRMKDNTGALDHAFEAVADDSAFKFNQALAAIKATAIIMGGILAPLATDLADFVARLATAFGKLSPRMKKAILVVVGLAAALGPLLIVLGSVITAIGLIASPIGIAVAAAIVLGASFATLMVKSERFRDVVSGAMRVVGEAAEEYWPRVKKAGQDVMTWYQTNLAPVIRQVVDTLSALWRRFGDEILAVMRATFEVLIPIIRAAFDTIKNTVTLFLAILRGDWGDAWRALKNLVRDSLGNILDILKAQLELLKAQARLLGTALIEGLKSGLSGLAGLIRDVFSGIGGTIKSFFSGASGWLVGAGKAIMRGLWEGMKKIWRQISDWLGSLGGWIGDLKGPLTKDRVLLLDQGKAIIGGLERGMRLALPSVLDTVSGIAPSIRGVAPVAVSPGGAGAGATYVINVPLSNVYGDADKAALELRDRLKRMVNAGQIPDVGLA
jgi:TP901 family phage tail tape measure protein